MTPRLHEREMIVAKVTSDLRQAVNKATEDLTVWETVRVVSDVLGGFLGSLAKYGIREERHPGDTETPGGWE